MISIASIYPSHHAHQQLEIKKHEKARINPQIKQQMFWKISLQGLSLGKRP
jgi:hypothetical protein